MKSWLHKPPSKPPDQPEHVDLLTFNYMADKATAKGAQPSPLVAYVREHGPKLAMDEWGQALPLSSFEQSDLDRLVAVLKDPLNRTRDLLLSGLLNADEVAAVKSVHPEVYSALVNACMTDMVTARPPFALWAQSILGVIFEKPAAQMYSDADQAQDSPTGKPGGGSNDVNAIPTPNDRRELAIRQQG